MLRNEEPQKFPFFIRATYFLIFMYALISMLFIAKGLIVTLIFATMLAMLLSPVVRFFINLGFKRIWGVVVVVFFALVILAGLSLLIFSQASILSESWPGLVLRVQSMWNDMMAWVSNYFDLSRSEIKYWNAEVKTEVSEEGTAILGTTISTLGEALKATVIIPVYVFMILLYQEHLVMFVQRVFGPYNQNKVSDIMTNTKGIIQSYIVGIFFEVVILAVLNTLGLLLLGIEYAVLLGILSAFLNIIPYIGGLIGVAVFMLIALLTKSPEYVFYVLGLYALIQFVDNNYIVPKIVGSRVKLNALTSLIAVLVGAALWGIPGMFLSIPLAAIIKLIFDRLPEMKPWGFLMGEPEKVEIDKVEVEKE